ncbi:hypothetical protein [Bosea sp. 124]|uniref:hypothetical protein n=1 Tax=Bosea sp. 124 TaxID=2135642 RepID=UPI000D361503|nr:hypothetical protein [Bosea sp. 124]PTM43238.1 hypothetical protein C8D03_4848 [Bosea sp. 124]
MAVAVILTVVGMAVGVLLFVAAAWLLRRSKVFDAFDVGLGGISAAAIIGGFLGHRMAGWLGLVAA